MEIIELTTADVDACAALWAACDLTRPWNDPVLDARRAVTAPSSAILGIRGTSGLIGTVMVGGDGHRGWVYYLAVDPARRNEGWGRRLMEAAERWLIDHGLPKIQFMVRSTNTAVLGFYESLGYERQEVEVLGRRLDDPTQD